MGIVIGKTKRLYVGHLQLRVYSRIPQSSKDNPLNQYFTKIPVFAEQTLNYVFFHIKFVVNWKLLLQRKDFGVVSIFLY
jgi:hypothetical protein